MRPACRTKAITHNMHDPSRRGKFDPVLFRTYRALEAGPEKRRLLGQLVFENEPLVKVLLDQVIGRGPAKKHDLKLPGSGLKGLRDVEWDDAYQCALLALVKAMDCFDPDKGKLAAFVKWKILYEIQCLVQREGLSRVPRGKEDENVSFELGYTEQDLDQVSKGSYEGGLITSEDFGESDVRRWQRKGVWPETPEQARAEVRYAKVRRDERDARQARHRAAIAWNPAAQFCETQLRFANGLRTARIPLLNRFDAFLASVRAYSTQDALRCELRCRGTRPVTVRVEWSDRPVGGIAGVALM
jgi:hypothetical protein